MNRTPRTLAALLLACTALAAHADNRAYRNTSLGNLEFTSPSKKAIYLPTLIPITKATTV